MALSQDAIIFGLGYLNGPKCKLSFGGDGAAMEITRRGREALNELLAAGYAETAASDDQIQNREHYCGTILEPHLGEIAQSMGLDPFDSAHSWTSFTKIERGEAPKGKNNVSLLFSTGDSG